MDIAVIVPVYNVEKYIKNCIDSILNQTQKNYNIYLVDDGSTDASGKICDQYAAKYSNIKVFHKENGGLSDARNYGVSHTTEPIISFIDSDDTIREDYICKLYNAMIESKCDISIANFTPVKNEPKDKKGNLNNSFVKQNTISFLKSALLGKNGSLSSCCKFFKRYLLVNNRFPKGKLYEDMEVIYNIINSVNEVAYIDENLYFYLTRDNSIVQSKVTENHKYGLLSCIHMLEIELNNGNKKMIKYLKCRIVKQACGHLPNLAKYYDVEMFSDISKIVKPYLNSVIFGTIAPLKTRILAIAYYMKPKNGIRYSRKLFNIKRKLK